MLMRFFATFRLFDGAAARLIICCRCCLLSRYAATLTMSAAMSAAAIFCHEDVVSLMLYSAIVDVFRAL